MQNELLPNIVHTQFNTFTEYVYVHFYTRERERERETVGFVLGQELHKSTH